jgi:hypothetical protein
VSLDSCLYEAKFPAPALVRRTPAVTGRSEQREARLFEELQPLPCHSTLFKANPVIFPPRRLRLETMPVLTSAGCRQTRGFDLYSMRRNVTSLVVVGLTGGHSI